MTITTRAPAKINLDLRVLGTRRDGFHDLRTLLHSIELHDTLSFRDRAGPLTVRSRTPGVPQDRENIVWRAARELWTALGRRGQPRDVAVLIHKAIPMAAGLGGGSSDAACALRSLCALWEVAPGRACLRRVASRIGSDVPFFLDGGVVLASGRGERVHRVKALTPFWVMLALPRFGVSTADAYRWFDADGSRHRMSADRGRLPRGWRDRMGSLVNHLEPVVAARHPDILAVVDALRATDTALAAMTGSGTAVFGLFDRRAAALAARRAVRRPGWRTIMSRTVGRTEFARLTRVVQRGR